MEIVKEYAPEFYNEVYSDIAIPNDIIVSNVDHIDHVEE